MKLSRQTFNLFVREGSTQTFSTLDLDSMLRFTRFQLILTVTRETLDSTCLDNDAPRIAT